MATVYSYERFSSKKQAKGDSLRRQLAGRAWIDRNGHTAATMTLQDLGVSAFRGKNKHVGALSEFLKATDDEQVKPGSILLVENLDRLSREEIDPAYDLFRRIIRAGVIIVVLMPHEAQYTRESLNDPMAVFKVVWEFWLHNQESAKKSKRIGELWENRRAELAAGKRRHFSRRCPSWIEWDAKAQRFILNDGAAAVRYIYQRTVEGCGQRRLLAELSKRFKPIGTSGNWNTSFVQKVLSDRAVLGEYQPCKFTADGERIPAGPPIPGYYPAVIDEPMYDRAQASKANRAKQKGPNGKFVNLFTGLLINAHDGSAMHVQTVHSGGKVQRRLTSYAHSNRQPGADPVSVSLQVFEWVFLAYLSEVRADDLQPSDSTKEARQQKQEQEQQLAGITGRLGKLQAVLEDPTADEELDATRAAIRNLQQRAKSVKQELERLKQCLATDRPLEQSQGVVKMLDSAGPEQAHELRLRLRGLIADLVEVIYVAPEKWFGRVYCKAQIFFKSGGVKEIAFHPGCRAPIPQRMAEQERIDDCLVDLSDREQAQRPIFEGLARFLTQPAQVTIPNEIPSTVGGSAGHWLSVCRRSMSPVTYRMIPAKLGRFVALVGKDLPAAKLDGKRWKQWVKALRADVTAGRLQHNTARVTYSRAREYVRWLIQQGRVAPIQGLDLSGEKALA